MKIDQNFYLNSHPVNGNKSISSSTSSNLSNISDLIPENTSGKNKIHKKTIFKIFLRGMYQGWN